MNDQFLPFVSAIGLPHCGRRQGGSIRRMPNFIYSAWFLDRRAASDDQDREWVACISIEADRAVIAQSWGDALAKGRSDRHPDEAFLRSSVAAANPRKSIADFSDLPQIKAGEVVSDAIIGW